MPVPVERFGYQTEPRHPDQYLKNTEQQKQAPSLDPAAAPNPPGAYLSQDHACFKTITENVMVYRRDQPVFRKMCGKGSQRFWRSQCSAAFGKIFLHDREITVRVGAQVPIALARVSVAPTVSEQVFLKDSNGVAARDS